MPINGGYGVDAVFRRANQTAIYFYHNRMGFRRASTLASTPLPFRCYLVRHDATAAVVRADDGLACGHWSLLLNGYRCETRWNDLLTVRGDFGDSLDCDVAGRADDFDSDMTYHLDSYSSVNVVQNAVTELPDCLWP